MDGLPWVTHSARRFCWDLSAGRSSGRLGRFTGAGSLWYHPSDHVWKPSWHVTVVARREKPQSYSMRLAVPNPVEESDGRDDSIQATGRKDLPWLSGISQSRIKRARLCRHPGMVGAQ